MVRKALLVLTLVIVGVMLMGMTPEEYVKQHRNEVSWRIMREETLEDGMRLVFIELKSQVWRNIEWEHTLVVAFPPNMVRKDVAVLLAGGDDAEEEVLENLWLPKVFKLPFCALSSVPNQPLFGGYREDALIAYTFEKTFETLEEDWPLLLPMVQSVVAAMDAVQEYTGSLGAEIDKFVITGASKRGWTTWLTGAVDSRVVAIIPMVYDNLNLPRQMKHQLDFWGRYSEKISDYTERGLPDKISTPIGKKLVKIVDPYYYLEEIKVPKLIIIATNDRYWPIDAINFYFDDVLPPKYILYLPNERHSFKNHGLVATAAAAFVHAVLDDRLPRFEWKWEGNLLEFTLDVEPEEVNLWFARSNVKDFRNALFIRRKLPPTTRKVRVPTVHGKYTVAFIEVIIQSDNMKLRMCTNAKVFE